MSCIRLTSVHRSRSPCCLARHAPESTHLFPVATWEQLGVEHISGTTAVRVDPDNHRIQLSDDRMIPYERLLFATGGRVRKLAVPGADLPGIHYLRTIDDSLSLAAELGSGGRLLVVGGGWIGLEVAAAARKRGMAVVLIEAATQLCGRALAGDIAGHLDRLAPRPCGGHSAWLRRLALRGDYPARAGAIDRWSCSRGFGRGDRDRHRTQ